MRPPADIGNGIVCASFAADGSWLSVGTTSADVGFVELNGMPRFDESRRGHVAAVRDYRRLMADPRHAFLTVEGATTIDRRAVPGQRAIEQRYVAVGDAAARPRVVVRFGGRLDRPAYAEVTDVSPLPPLALAPSLTARGDRLVVETGQAGIDAELEVRVFGVATRSGWTIIDDTSATFDVEPGDAGHAAGPTLSVVVTINAHGPRCDGDAVAASATPVRPAPGWLAVPPRLRRDVARVAGRGVRYTLDCTALRVTDDESTILTDHRILPLSWTRDAYYQALAVLGCAAAGRGAGATVARIGDHLRWLWVRCERPGGVWQRSYQANGSVKDWAVQADQQLYPLLELLDYRDVAGTWPSTVDKLGVGDWGQRVRSVWSALPRDGATGLLTSEENPADDDTAELPLLLSTQVLYWHTARRLAIRAAELSLDDLRLGPTADAIRSGTLERFATDGPFGRQWFYAVDGRGHGRRYHDANDLPVALAPRFGFVAADDLAWDATMRFAFSPENPAFVAGPFGGLGSAHTPGVWPLGDIQEWVWAAVRGDEQRVDATLARLATVASPDGLLPETYDPADGSWLSRPWFAWPGSAVAALVAGALG